MVFCGNDVNKPQSHCRRAITKMTTYVFVRLILFLFGILWISRYKYKIKDFDDDYPKEESKKRACIVVSNHSGFMEGFLYSHLFQTGFLVK